MMSYFGLSGTPVAPNNVSFGDALRRSGLNPVETTMALPYMFLAPAGSDPDMQAVQVIIRGLQFHLNRAGFPLAMDGKLGPMTARALNRVSPPSGSYAAKPWFQLYADVMRAAKGGSTARVTGSRVVSVSAVPMGDDLVHEDTHAEAPITIPGASISPIWIAAGVVGLYLFSKKGRR